MMRKSSWIKPLIAAAALMGAVACGDSSSTTGGAGGGSAGRPEQTLAFPADQAIGTILTRPVGSDSSKDWVELGPAKGEIKIPAGKESMLRITAASASDLSPLDSLKSAPLDEIVMEGLDVSDDQLIHLMGLANVVGLNMNGTPLSDFGLARVCNVTSLKKLAIAKTKVTDTGMHHLTNIPTLERLWLHGCQVGDSGLAAIASMKTIRRLVLAETQVTSAGLVHLKGMKNLEFLALEGTSVDDGAIDHLLEMKNLKRLIVARTKISAEGIKRFSAGLPGCEITN